MKNIAGTTWKRCLLTIGLLGLISILFQPLLNALSKCNGTVNAQTPIVAPTDARTEGTLLAVTSTNNLISFNQATPGAIIRNIPITGLVTGDQVVGLSARATNSVLYAVSQTSRLYTLSTVNGAATLVSPTPFLTPLNGAAFGVNFNPTVDRLRIVSNVGQNLRINPNNGALVAVDGNLTFAAGDLAAGTAPNIVAVAYTNNWNGSIRTSLYGITAGGSLVLIGSPGGAPVSPNTGITTTAGQLGVTPSGPVSFVIPTIGPDQGGAAFASFTPPGGVSSALYTINLQTGAASSVGTIGAGPGVVVTAMSVVLRVESVFAVTSDNRLIRFSSGDPGTILSSLPITSPAQGPGPAFGEVIMTIDFRKSTQVLYGISNFSRIFAIDPATGSATAVSTRFLVPSVNSSLTDVAVNPVVDRLRLVNNNQQNLRIDMSTGLTANVDGPLAFAPGDLNATIIPNVIGAAYTNNIPGATVTTLYGIESGRNVLVVQGSINGSPVSPNTGQLTTVGNLGVTVNPQAGVGFDTAAQTNAAFATMTPAGSAASSFYTINLNTGLATPLGAVGGGQTVRSMTVIPRANLMFALTAGNRLLRFNEFQPSAILGSAPITGVTGGNLVGVTYRAANGRLYGLDAGGNLYTIDTTTGAATRVGPSTPVQLNGTVFGFATNPVPDRLRLVSNAGQNLRLVPDTGAIAGVDGTLVYDPTDLNANQPPSIVAAGYDNFIAGTPSTTLYVIDSNLDTLATQGAPGGLPVSPNTGRLFTIGQLGVDTSPVVSFDIAPRTNTAYALLTVGGVSQLHTINLITGRATLVGSIGGGDQITCLAVATPLFRLIGQ